MNLSIRTNVDEVFRDIDAFLNEAKAKVMMRSLNELEGRATVVGFRKIADLYDLGPRTIEKYASVKLASLEDLEARVTVKGNGFPLSAFGARQVRGGVSVKIKGRRYVFPHTFMATMPNGHVGVFARGSYGNKSPGIRLVTGRIGRFVLGRGYRVKAKNRWGVTERPANELYTFAPADTFSNNEVTTAMLDRIEESAPAVVKREMDTIRRGH